MITSFRPEFELRDVQPAVAVPEAEYRRLLGYPRHHVPGERADELAAWARRWFAAHGRPWVDVREVGLQFAGGALLLDGTEFRSPALHDHLRAAGAERVLLVAVSAGPGCEEHARQLWNEGKPDEYFFLEVFGSAVVEQLVAATNGRLCDLAERAGWMAVPHYAPGYTGWDVADQTELFALLVRKAARPFPEPLAVLSSGMLQPKKSLLAVVGLAPGAAPARTVPCVNCSFSPCQYRRAPYRFAPPRAEVPAAPAAPVPPTPALHRDARYATSVRALRKWAQERVRIERMENGTLAANFRFDGTTCSNQGRPLAFDYAVALSAPENGCVILETACRPAPDDTGHTAMCAYLADAAALLAAIEAERPLVGRPLNEVVDWVRPSAPSGCYCTAESRTHKWGLALEAIHYALVHAAPEHHD